MRNFDYIKIGKGLVNNHILNQLVELNRMNVKWSYIIDSGKYDFEDFAKQAMRESIVSSNRTEWLRFNDKMVDWLLKSKSPYFISDIEILGYKSALEDIFQSDKRYSIDDIDSLVKHFKQFEETSSNFVRRECNRIFTEYDRDGKEMIGLHPVEFYEIDEYLDLISAAFNRALRSETVNSLLVVPACILDIIKVYPLSYISVQIAKLLLVAMLWSFGFKVVKYISIEKIIEDNSYEYYSSLAMSLENWDDGTNDYRPFVCTILDTILEAYREFERRTYYIVEKPLSKPERVEQYIKDSEKAVTKKDILYYCPDISETTIEIALRDLKNKGKIKKIGGGRYTSYLYNK